MISGGLFSLVPDAVITPSTDPGIYCQVSYILRFDCHSRIWNGKSGTIGTQSHAYFVTDINGIAVYL